MTRGKLVAFIAGLPRCVVAMEACCGAHHLGRLFEGQGHEVRLMSPEYVQPYVACCRFRGQQVKLAWRGPRTLWG
jgi:transposase